MSQPTGIVRCERFRPKQVEGVRDVVEVAIFPDRLELLIQSAPTLTIVEFVEMAARPFSGFFWRWAFRHGLRRRPFIAEAYLASPSERCIKWYSRPSITVYLPEEDAGLRGQTRLARVQEIIQAGGFQMMTRE